eukprot:m.75000 g.75000  ORF g.75000 m.75000 type:complete len:592 (-) comp24724_c0_seq3:94-1869(-)
MSSKFLLVALPAAAFLLSVFTVFYIGSLHTHDVMHEAEHGRRDQSGARPPDNDAVPNTQQIKTIEVSFEEDASKGTFFVRVGASTSDQSIKDAIGMAVNTPISEFGLQRKHDEVFVAVSYHSLEDKTHYAIIPIRPSDNHGGTKCNSAAKEPAFQREQPGSHGKGIRNKKGVTLSDKPARLPRVVLTALGTGRYREMALDALKSAAEFFGGDCVPTFHLITDNLTDVDPRFNVVHAPYREWPESGLSKFEDIRNGLGTEIASADYFYFMDADIRFKDRVQLADVAGDLVGVEHPMYPRYDFGWCKPGDPTTRGWCAYPFSRDNKSTAYIPEGHGRYVKEGKYVVSNAYYYQSAFWGGKAAKVIALIDELVPRINTNRANGVYSKIIQDELFLNWYFWKHSNDSDLNIRTLSPSYLYPMQRHGFTDWVTKENRAIIVHGIGKKAGKLINGATELHVIGLNLCVDMFAGTGWSKIGLYGCNHVADSQGLLYEQDTKIIRSMAAGVHRCMDASGLAPLDSVGFIPCNLTNTAMKWSYDGTTHVIKNHEHAHLCLDALRDPSLFDATAKDSKKKPLGVNTCNPASKYQQFEFRPI